MIFLGLLALVPASSNAEEPMIVAIDTSRSLSPSQLQSTISTINGILAQVPSKTPLGLLAFDDTPRWIVSPPSTAEALRSALADLKPEGNYTLLNDALFTAARQLENGGIILLLTDGRDENSATTVEDVADLCRANHVRIIAIGTGRRVDEKAMRRLALLTDGASVGHADTIDLAVVSQVIQEATLATASEVENARLAEATAKPVEVQAVAAPQTVREISTTPWWLLPLLLVLIVAVLATLLMLLRWRRPVETEQPENPDWETDPAIIPETDTNVAREPTVDLPPAPPMDDRADELILDPSAFERLPFDGDIDTTSVLDEQHILSVMEPGKEIRSFRLRNDRAFAVGRAPGVNTLTLTSRALSSQHFKIVPHENGFAVVDLDSTNGTLVNGRRIRAHHLEAGDTIQAGEVEFEFKVILRSLL
jgi:hypothetical protein